MPVESAMSLMLRNFEQWRTENREDTAEPRQAGRVAQASDFKRPDDSVVRMLQMVMDGRCLVVEELDEIIGYFQKQRDVMAKAQGITPASKSVAPPG